MRGTGPALVYEHPVIFIIRLSVRGLHSMLNSLDNTANITSSRRVPAANPHSIGELSAHSDTALPGNENVAYLELI